MCFCAWRSMTILYVAVKSLGPFEKPHRRKCPTQMHRGSFSFSTTSLIVSAASDSVLDPRYSSTAL